MLLSVALQMPTRWWIFLEKIKKFFNPHSTTFWVGLISLCIGLGFSIGLAAHGYVLELLGMLALGVLVVLSLIDRPKAQPLPSYDAIFNALLARVILPALTRGFSPVCTWSTPSWVDYAFVLPLDYLRKYGLASQLLKRLLYDYLAAFWQVPVAVLRKVEVPVVSIACREKGEQEICIIGIHVPTADELAKAYALVDAK